MGQFFIHRPVFAAVVSLVILLAGGLVLFTLPVTLYPQITPPTVEVEINYPGANAETVESSIASAVETEVNGAEDMIYFTSKSSSDGRYLLQCSFEVGKDLDLANVDINNRVNKATPKLPPEAIASGISIKKKSPDMLMAISLYSPDGAYDEVYLSNYCLLNIVDRVARVPGVGSTMIIGQRDYSIRLWLRPDKLTKLGMTAADIANAVKEQNVLLPTGSVGQPPAAAGVEFQYAINARTELAAKTYTSFGRFDGQDATILLVYQLPGANAIQTADGIRKVLSDLGDNMPPGLEYDITLDNTTFIRSSIEEVKKTFYEALVLVLVVVFAFLGSFRATLVPLLAIPVSLLGTFAFFAVLGFSVNMLTLFGLILAIGTVVDDAIVVVESVEVYLAKWVQPCRGDREDDEGRLRGADRLLAGALRRLHPGGVHARDHGQLCRQFALTISVSIVLSLVVALSLTPAMCRLILRERKPMRGPLGWFLRKFDKGVEKVISAYGAVTRVMVRSVVIGLVLLGVLSYGAWHLLATLPGGFVPDEDQG